ncbi:hypothetical protein ABZ733_08325 [Streptomyces longwoodensis]|uniref:hypothetical protein n=1 Tax=Streptomyces longwoodensis TaxID=68231 RepID=UPI0033FB4F30
MRHEPSTAAAEATDRATSALHQLFADAFEAADYALPVEQRHALAEAAVAAILPTTRLIGSLHGIALADVHRVIALYEQWVKAGPPPLGTSVSRWWDARLIELRNAILPSTDQTTEK